MSYLTRMVKTKTYPLHVRNSLYTKIKCYIKSLNIIIEYNAIHTVI